MSAGIWVAIAAVVLASALGCYRALTNGRFRGTRRVPIAPATTDEKVDTVSASSPSPLADTEWADQLGDRATLVQFSSAFCAPCRAARRTLADVAGTTHGVAHLEIDAEHHLELVRRLGVLRTPTTLVLDERGLEVTRAAGAPTRAHVAAALAAAGVRD